MKKLLKSCLAVALVFITAFSFVGCGTKLSATTVDTSKVKTVNGVSTNGGMTAIYDGYLYFINGTKTNDGKSVKKNTKSAICKVAYNEATGETSGDVEVVVDGLVGFEDGSIRFYGDFMYYAVPCSDKNYKGDVLYNKTTFMRYDLVNKKSYELYTTELNSADEKVSYAYYVVDNTLNLVVYEASNKTITSLKIDKKVVENYKIINVTGCVMSENNGTVVTPSATVDANSYVFYTKSPEQYESVQSGSKVFRTSAVKDNSYLLSTGYTVTLDSIMAGKLITTMNDKVYIHEIKGSTTEALKFEENCISYAVYTNAIFLEDYAIEYTTGAEPVAQLVKKAGNVCVLYISNETFYFMIMDWTSGNELPAEKVSQLHDVKDVLLHGIAFVEEEIEEDVVEEPEGEEPEGEEPTEEPAAEPKKRTVMFAVYSVEKVMYKIEIAEVVDATTGTLEISHWTNPVQLSSTKTVADNGLLVPEIIGEYLFILAEDKDKNVYMHKISLSNKESVSKEATKVWLEEKK